MQEISRDFESTDPALSAAVAVLKQRVDENKEDIGRLFKSVDTKFTKLEVDLNEIRTDLIGEALKRWPNSLAWIVTFLTGVLGIALGALATVIIRRT